MGKGLFADDQVDLELLRKYAFWRWGALPPDVIPLTAADPDFPVAQEIRQAIKVHAEGGLLGYGPTEGIAGFREIAARTAAERHGLSCTPDLIMPTGGAAAAMWIVAKYALQPGDQAIIFDPVDLLFGLSVDAAGGRRVYSPVDRGTGAFDLEGMRALITPRTRLLCLCNPHNPLGRVLTRDELTTIAQIAVEHDLLIMSDEVWSDIVYKPNSHISIATLGPEVAARTVSIYGLSKTFALAGLRVGFLVAPDRAMFRRLDAVARVLGAGFGITTLGQVAGMAAYEDCWYWAEAFLDHLREVRDVAVQRLNGIPGVRCLTPEGTYVLFPDVSRFGKGSAEMTDYLLREARVMTVPGTVEWFGPGAAGHIRLCFSTSMAIMREALDRLEDALSRLGSR